MEEDAQESGAIKAAIRSAKKTQRPVKIGEKQPQVPSKAKAKDKARKHRVTASKNVSVFDKDLGQRPAARREGVRAKKSDKIGGVGKKGPKRKSK